MTEKPKIHYRPAASEPWQVIPEEFVTVMTCENPRDSWKNLVFVRLDESHMIDKKGWQVAVPAGVQIIMPIKFPEPKDWRIDYR